MLLDLKSLPELGNISTKFIRIGDEIYIIGEEEEGLVFHRELAQKHKVLEKVEDLRTVRPDDLDGGMIYIQGKIVRIGSSSDSLGIPLTTKARRRTIDKLQDRHPSFSVKELVE